jgi:S-(hydroxymethyl)glutathione dehydrogenase/alcohol dehydrogenase
MRGIVYFGDKTELVEDLEVRMPGPREVLVQVVAAGFCHSDSSFMNGLYEWPTPAVCGHEGAGIVLEVGAGVTHVQRGDHVIVATLAACGTCERCASGRPTSCRATLGNWSETFTLGGRPVNNFAGASVFADRTVVRDVQCVPIPDDVPFESAALVGCGVVTGMGAVLNRADVQLGHTAAVWGVGGVGLNVIQALKLRRARRIIAVDVVAEKEAIARRFGATDFLLGTRDDLVDAIAAMEPYSDDSTRGPFNAGGVDWTFDCVARPEVTYAAIEALDWGGTCVVIGVAAATAEFHGLYGRLTQVDRGVVGVRYGTIAPHRDIPLIIDLYRRGEILLDELVSTRRPLADFEQVLDAMETGTIARGVLTM